MDPLKEAVKSRDYWCKELEKACKANDNKRVEECARYLEHYAQQILDLVGREQREP